MNSRSFIVFVCLVVAAAAFVFSIIDQLPETVATHYGASSRANGWMTRSGYLLFMMVFLLGFYLGFVSHRIYSAQVAPSHEYSQSWLLAGGGEAGRLAAVFILARLVAGVPDRVAQRQHALCDPRSSS